MAQKPGQLSTYFHLHTNIAQQGLIFEAEGFVALPKLANAIHEGLRTFPVTTKHLSIIRAIAQVEGMGLRQELLRNTPVCTTHFRSNNHDSLSAFKKKSLETAE